ncbi:Uncharacterised protein [Mycobacterium tuberculosis]|nr:Uncharacterised protein [Mycobacterium tuberculosis]
MMPAVAVTKAGACRRIEIRVAKKPTPIAAVQVATTRPNPAAPSPMSTSSASPAESPAVATERSGA